MLALSTPLNLNALADEIHRWGVEKGWSEPETDWSKIRETVIEKLLMIHTEVSEAVEELRDLDFKRSPEYSMAALRESCTEPLSHKPEGVPSELIDILIRVLHLCRILGIDINVEMLDKMNYNWSRPHRHGGKSL